MASGNSNLSPNDWIQFYQSNIAQQISSTDPPPPPPPGFRYASAVADATVVTTTATINAPAPTITFGSGGGNTGSPHRNAEGRVGKASRRRSRASRQAPTTLLNTDTTNFRAMVQQFTGNPAGPLSSGYPGGRPSFGLDAYHRHLEPTTTMIPARQHHHQHQQLAEEQLMFSLRDGNDDFFVNPRPAFETNDGFTESFFRRSN